MLTDLQAKEAIVYAALCDLEAARPFPGVSLEEWHVELNTRWPRSGKGVPSVEIDTDAPLSADRFRRYRRNLVGKGLLHENQTNQRVTTAASEPSK